MTERDKTTLKRIRTGSFERRLSLTRTGLLAGTRYMAQSASSLLLPQARLKATEGRLDYTARLALTEELKDLPFAAVWAEHCARADCPTGAALILGLERYQAKVATRG